MIFTASVLRVHVTWQRTNVKLPDDDIEMLKHAGVLYFPALKTHWTVRRAVIFSLEILEKNNDECILILVIYWKKTGLLRT